MPLLSQLEKLGVEARNGVRVSRVIDYASHILENDLLMRIINKADRGKHVQIKEPRLGSIKGLRGILEALSDKREPYLLVIDLSKDAVAKLIVHNGVIVAACIASAGKEVCGYDAVEIIESRLGDRARVAVVELPKQLYDWTPEFSVYVRGIDLQHKQLIRMTNNLYYLFLIGKPQAILIGLLNFLREYAELHFSSEERLLKKYDYPRLEQHQKEHMSFIEQTKKFIESYRRGEKRLAAAILAYLVNWIPTHIKVSDKDYGRWLKQQGYV